MPTLSAVLPLGAESLVVAAPFWDGGTAIGRYTKQSAWTMCCPLATGSYVIGGTRPDRPRTDLKKPWAAVSRRARIEGVRLHDLRQTFASIGGASLGRPIVGKLLGHSQPRTTTRYADLDADPLLRAANLIGQRIESAMNPTAAIDSGETRRS